MEKIRKQNQPKKFFCWHAENYRHKKQASKQKLYKLLSPVIQLTQSSTKVLCNKSFM